ncbi:MAG: hypothetical protein NTW50_02800 [Candidatus Berkelbacteria bacterium]|nr:hypothetical protein [Candidatus Berkelbacteria bacterium]
MLDGGNFRGLSLESSSQDQSLIEELLTQDLKHLVLDAVVTDGAVEARQVGGGDAAVFFQLDADSGDQALTPTSLDRETVGDIQVKLSRVEERELFGHWSLPLKQK